MSDDKADNNPAPEEEIATIPNSDAQPAAEPAKPEEAVEENKLSGLMADAPAKEKEAAKPAVDLEAEAMRAAEAAVAEGEQALAQAQVELQKQAGAQAAAKPAASGNKKKELALRVLLAVNILAMLVVSMMPSAEGPQGPVTPVATEPPVKDTPKPIPMSEPFNRAMQASQNRDFASAVAILEQYLNDAPMMHSAERLSVFLALSNYAARDLDTDKSQRYRQKAQALEQSHHLPEDLVKMAESALKTGDQEALRRTWARFLLQQRQIPSWLYQHVAQAYLQLGDSYRSDADTAAEAAKLLELQEATARLRAEAMREGGNK